MQKYSNADHKNQPAGEVRSMIVKLTEEATNKLRELTASHEGLPRIDAEMAGGCGMSITFSIVFDEPRRNDLYFEWDGIKIRLDRFTSRYLNEETEIDYQEGHGFLVGDSFSSSACALEIDELRLDNFNVKGD